ncbi:MAG: MFS transporter [bacterium]
MQQGSLASDQLRIGIRRLLALASVSLAVTLIVMDGSIVNVALPTLVRALGGASNSELQWIVDGYILVFATLLLSMGNAADRFGRRRLLILGAVLFGAASVGATTSVSPGGLIGWRAAMGVGAAMIFPSTLAILTHEFPEPRLRRMAIGVWASCSGLGVAIGPVVGGWILRHHPWSAIFLVNVPIVVVIAAGVLLTVRESRESSRGPIDLLGNTLAIAGLLALVWSLIEAPERGWGSWPVLVGLGTGIALLVLFLHHERRVEHPLLDLAFVGSRACMSACLAIAAAFFGLFGFVFMVTQYFQFVKGLDPFEAGIRTLPFAGAIVVGAAVAAWAGRVRSPRTIASVGLLCMSAGFGWAVVDGTDTPYSVLIGQMGALGLGLGLVSAAATEVVMSSLASDRLGLASSLNDTARELGGTLGVAAMGSVFNAVYRSDVDAAFVDSPLPEAAHHAVRESLGVALGVAERVGEVAGAVAAAKVRGPVLDAFLSGFHASSLLAAALALAGAGAAFVFMPRRRNAEPESPAHGTQSVHLQSVHRHSVHLQSGHLPGQSSSPDSFRRGHALATAQDTGLEP